MKIKNKTVRATRRRPTRAAAAPDPIVEALSAASISRVPHREPGEFTTEEAAEKVGRTSSAVLRDLKRAEAAGKLTSRLCRVPGVRVPVRCWRRVP